MHMHIARLGWLAVAVLAMSTAGCQLLGVIRIQGPVAVKADFDPIVFMRNDVTHCFPTLYHLDEAVKSGLAPVVPEYAEFPLPLGFSSSDVPVARFLHVSDVHIRDADILRDSGMEKSLALLDRYVGSAQRLAHTEAFDSLVFAAFLSGYAKANVGPKAPVPPAFIIHGGDLIDVSLITELVEGLRILRGTAKAYPAVPIYTMVGNHDGLYLGNLPSELTDTLGLAVTGPEFVLGHLLADPVANRGFGFGGNEMLVKFGEDSVPPAALPSACCFEERLKAIENTDLGKEFAGQLRQIAWAARKRASLLNQSDVGWLLGCPAVVHQAIYTTPRKKASDIKCGYYSWAAETKIIVSKETTVPLTIRFIVLDTRPWGYQDGDIDDIQLGWFYSELVKARNAKECVVIFAHHKPDDLVWWCNNKGHFKTLLKAFPNIAGYFYGHCNENVESWPKPAAKSSPPAWEAFSNRTGADEGKTPAGPRYIHDLGRFALIETGSTADFPQTAREIEVYARKEESGESVKIGFSWRHVRPAGKDSTRDGAVLTAALFASRRDAREELNNKVSILDKLFAPERVGSIRDWDRQCLHNGQGVVEITFAEPTGGRWAVKSFKAKLEKIREARDKLDLPPKSWSEGHFQEK
jgi:hypothetical protein